MLLPESITGESDDLLADSETATTEIVLLPDGRICLFGASRGILELLEDLQLGDSGLDARLAAIRQSAIRSPQETVTTP